MNRNKNQYFDPKEVPELTIFRIYVEGQIDEYYWELDLKDKTNKRYMNVTTGEKPGHYRNRIIYAIDNLLENKEGLSLKELEEEKKNIGDLIYCHLKLGFVFDILFEEVDSACKAIVISTNDFQIPWEWATSRETGETLGDRFVIGYLDINSIGRYKDNFYNPSIFSSIIGSGYRNYEEAKKSSVIICGNLNGTDLGYSEFVSNEISKVKKLFEVNNFKKILIPKHEYLNSGLTRAFRSSDNIQIVHYVGHISKNGHICFNDEVPPLTAEELLDIRLRRTAFAKDGSLVFLNGCSAGKVTNVYDKPSQYPTAFAEMGAHLCIAPRFEIPLPFSTTYVETFYNVLLNEESFNLPIADILIRTRKVWKDKIKTDSNFNNTKFLQLSEHLPDFYFLYGNPMLSVFPEKELKKEYDTSFDEKIEKLKFKMKKETESLDSKIDKIDFKSKEF